MAFRCQYSTILLTYSRCPYTKAELLECLMDLPKLPLEYFIAIEPHDEEKYPARYPGDSKTHLHAWIRMPPKINICNSRYFDVPFKAHYPDIPPEYNGVAYHPNIKRKLFGPGTHYLRKWDPNPLTNCAASYISLARDGKIEEATEAFISVHPRDYLVNKDRIDENIRKLAKKPRTERIRDIKTYTIPPELGDYQDWCHDMCTLLCGPSGIGKTQFLKSFCDLHNFTPFKIIRHSDQLKRIDPEQYKALIFDDMNFQDFTREAQIHILDMEEEAVVHCRHREVTLPPRQPRFFTCNPESWPPFPDIDDPAISRRVKVIHLEVKMYAP